MRRSHSIQTLIWLFVAICLVGNIANAVVRAAQERRIDRERAALLAEMQDLYELNLLLRRHLAHRAAQMDGLLVERASSNAQPLIEAMREHDRAVEQAFRTADSIWTGLDPSLTVFRDANAEWNRLETAALDIRAEILRLEALIDRAAGEIGETARLFVEAVQGVEGRVQLRRAISRRRVREVLASNDAQALGHDAVHDAVLGEEVRFTQLARNLRSSATACVETVDAMRLERDSSLLIHLRDNQLFPSLQRLWGSLEEFIHLAGDSPNLKDRLEDVNRASHRLCALLLGEAWHIDEVNQQVATSADGFFDLWMTYQNQDAAAKALTEQLHLVNESMLVALDELSVRCRAVMVHQVATLHASEERLTRRSLVFAAAVTLVLVILGSVVSLLVARVRRREARAEASLRESRQMLRQVLDSIPVGVFWKDRNCVYLGCNRLFAKDAGYDSPADIVGKTDADLAWQAGEVQGMMERDRRAMEADAAQYHIARRRTRPDGEEAWFDTNRIPLRDVAGNVVGILGTYEDLSDRRRAEQALRESQRNLQAIFDAAPVGMLLVDGDLVIKGANEQAAKTTGHHVSDVLEHKVGVGIGCPHATQTPDACGQGQTCQTCLFRCTLQDVVTGASPRCSGEYELARALEETDSDRWLSINAEPVTIDGQRRAIVAIEDVSNRKYSEQALRQSEERLELALKGAALGLWDVHVPTGQAVFNDRWAEMLGYSLDELEPHFDTWRRLLHPDDRARAERAFQLHVEGKWPFFETEFRMRTKAGNWKWIFVRGKAVEQGPGGRALRVAGTHLDITERKATEATLRAAKEAAEEASRMKSRFLANVSHEVRTPLNAIVGFSEVIQRTTTDDLVRRQARTILRESETLLQLINELLDHAKIEAGKLDLDFRPVDLRQLLNEIRTGIEPLASEKGLESRFTVSDDVPPYVVGDGLRIRQVLVNLISNAIKFTERGRVSVVVEPCVTAETETTLRFSVIDTGIGISADKQAAVFESFTQVDGSATRRYGGTGLGTTISKQLVEMMGGRIGFDSEPGKGSTFWFVLPVGVAPASGSGMTEVGTPVAAHRVQCTGYILVVEDYPPNQEVARLHLEEAGHRVRIVANGREAVTACEQETFDLILMDVQMPEMDGQEATQRIRVGSTTCATIPILGMTAHADRGSRGTCMASGMNEVIRKPVRRDMLLATVDHWLTARADNLPPATRPVPEPAPSYEAVVADTPIDYRVAIDEFGSPETVDLVVNQFLETLDRQLGVLRQAIEAGDADRARKEAHAIKGGAGTLEARPLAEVASRMEKMGTEGRLDVLAVVLDEMVSEFDRLKAYVERHAWADEERRSVCES
ncbi:MAG: PAS domain S-box protein [Phycisphaerae bacterium]|nr:PAS domain S-box protein [Phycisphaerae bacterium]